MAAHNVPSGAKVKLLICRVLVKTVSADGVQMAGLKVLTIWSLAAQAETQTANKASTRKREKAEVFIRFMKSATRTLTRVAL